MDFPLSGRYAFFPVPDSPVSIFQAVTVLV